MGNESRHTPPQKSGPRVDLMAQQAANLTDRRAMKGEGYESALEGGRSSGSRVSVLAVVLLFVVVLLAIAIPLKLSLGSDQEVSVWSADKKKKQAGVAPRKLPEVDESSMTSLSAEDMARAFLAAESWEERRQHVRDADKVSAHLEEYPEEVRTFPVVFSGLSSKGAVTPGDLIGYERFSVRMSSGGIRLLCVVQTEMGPRVDYDSFARYATESWEDLQDGQAAKEVRLMAEKDLYFNNGFQDEEKWVCFKLTSPDWPKTVWGYAPVGSITAELLTSIVSARSQRVTLALRSEADSHVRSQFLIEKVVINGWVRTPLDPEESLRMRLGQ